MARDNRIDIASRMVEATVAEVFAAVADPAAWERWLPPTGMSCSVDEFEFRDGGRYRLTMRYVDGSHAGKSSADTDVTAGTFIKIVPNERVIQRIEFESEDPAFAGAMRMTWLLEPLNEGTRVTFTAEDVPAGISPEDHSAGLQSTLENLALFVE